MNLQCLSIEWCFVIFIFSCIFSAKEVDGSSFTMNFSTITPTKGETVVMNMTYFLSKKHPHTEPEFKIMQC